MLRLLWRTCFVLLVAFPGFSSAGPITFAVTGAGDFGALDLATGSFTPIGANHPGGYFGIGNLSDGTLVAVDAANNFLRIDRTTGSVSTIGPTGVAFVVTASMTSGDQFGVDNSNRLYEINSVTGAATLVGSTGIPGISGFFGNALAGNGASLYYIYQQTGAPVLNSALYKLDTATGLATLIGLTGIDNIVGMGFDNDILFAYAGDFPIGGAHGIFSIDLNSGAATAVAPYAAGINIFGSNSAAVPEPSSFALFGLGGVAVVGLRRRLTKRA